MRMFFCSKPRPSRCRGGEFVRHRQAPARQTGYTAAAAVVRPGLSSDFAPQSDSETARVLTRHSLRRPYVLGVATVEPRKGLDSLVRAFCALQARAELKDYTRYEGFGMPVLEAPACGARVVTSDLAELHEGGGSDTI